MRAVLKGKITEIWEQMESESKWRVLSDSEFRQIEYDINKVMKEFRKDLLQKQAKSIADTAGIILSR